MSPHPDPDLLLVESMLAPPPLDDARSSLEYWYRRRRALPLYRRRARREARDMATRWEARVQAAEQARFDSTLLGRLLAALGISSSWVGRLRVRKRRLVGLGWAAVPRTMKLVAGAFAAALLFMVVAPVMVVVIVFVQLV
jgi:hypothetical protein